MNPDVLASFERESEAFFRKHGPVVDVRPNLGAPECLWCRWSRRYVVDLTRRPIPLCAVHRRAARRVAREMLRRLGM